MAWETYTRQIIRTGEPAITLGKMGRIGMNMVATNILENAKATHVVLMWDKEALKCALRIGTSKEAGAYKLTYNDKGNGAGFSAVTFLNYIHYDWTETRSFNAEWSDDEQMFVFSIPAEHFGGTGDRRQPVGNIKRPDRMRKDKEVVNDEKAAPEGTA
jgi:hypothetical protein